MRSARMRAAAKAASSLPRTPAEGADEALVAAARGGDDRALAELLEKYRGFARAKAHSYFLVGADREDIIQEGMIGLYKAIRDFNPEMQTSFRAFAEQTRSVRLKLTQALNVSHQTLTLLRHQLAGAVDEDDRR